MEQSKMTEEKLWDYIDGNVTSDEKSFIDHLIESDHAWKTKYSELLELNSLIIKTDLEAPSLRFTKNVMEEIGRLQIAPATKSYINKKIVWGISFFFIALFISFLVYGFGQMDFTTTGNSESTINQTLNKIDLSKFFNNTLVNVFMMINVVLALVLLDNYFSAKRAKFRERQS